MRLLSTFKTVLARLSDPMHLLLLVLFGALSLLLLILLATLY